MSAEWPCDHCGRTIGSKDDEPHVCSPVDIADEIEGRSDDRFDELEERVERLEKKLAWLSLAPSPDDLLSVAEALEEKARSSEETSHVHEMDADAHLGEARGYQEASNMIRGLLNNLPERAE